MTKHAADCSGSRRCCSTERFRLEVKTGATGAYIFRNLAAGAYTVAIENDGKRDFTDGCGSGAPANIRDINLNAGTKE